MASRPARICRKSIRKTGSQPVQRAGSSSRPGQRLGRSLPRNQVVCGDNLAVMARLPSACCDLIYADPPFFSGKNHTQAQGDHVLADCWPGGLSSYLEFLRIRLQAMHRLLKPSGVICLHLDWHVSHHGRLLLDEVFGPGQFLNEIIWSYRTGGVSRRWFGRKHDTLFIYARQTGRHRFHPVREGKFRTEGLNYDEQGRPYKSTRAGRLYFHPDGPSVTDVWDIPFLSTVSLERTGYPTQKPQALPARLIAAFTDPGDLVADFFCGSGTTLAAAQVLGRDYLGCDRAPGAVRIATRRLAVKQV